jgi:dihydropyrimidinase
VQLTATAPAELYNLPGKGALLPGYDADIAIWDPQKTVTITDAAMHDRTGFTPFAGRTVTGWPERVLRRGEEIVADGALGAAPGSGRWLGRTGGWASEPTGRLLADMDPSINFGAKLLD